MLLLTSSGESIAELILVLIIFVGVLFLTYYATRWIANYQKGQMVNQNLEIIETLKVSTNKYVQILRAGENRYLVVGIGKDEITHLGELTKDELILKEDSGTFSGSGTFRSMLDAFKKKDQDEDDK